VIRTSSSRSASVSGVLTDIRRSGVAATAKLDATSCTSFRFGPTRYTLMRVAGAATSCRAQVAANSGLAAASLSTKDVQQASPTWLPNAARKLATV
jgi:hypothetical protein